MSFNRQSSSSAKKLLAAAKAIASTAGSQRERAVAVLASMGTEHAFSLSYGSGVAYLGADGTVLAPADKLRAKSAVAGEVVEAENVLASEARTFIDQRLVNSAPLGSAGLNKVVDGCPIPYGVCVIVAGSGEGKTPLAHYLAGHGDRDYGVVRVGEPFAGYTTNVGEAASSIGRAALQCSDVVVDSIKDLLAQSGAAMRGGIARSALMDLSFWSILGATLGVTFYVPLNPSSGDEETLKMLVEVAKSNASMTLSKVVGDQWAFSVRPGEGQERVAGNIAFKRPRGSSVVEAANRSTDFASARDPVALGREVFSGAMQRSTIM